MTKCQFVDPQSGERCGQAEDQERHICLCTTTHGIRLAECHPFQPEPSAEPEGRPMIDLLRMQEEVMRRVPTDEPEGGARPTPTKEERREILDDLARKEYEEGVYDRVPDDFHGESEAVASEPKPPEDEFKIHERLVQYGLTDKQAEEIIDMVREFALAVLQRATRGVYEGL